MKEEIVVENIKCSGCMHSIQSALMQIENVTEVEIDLETEKITVNSTLPIDRAEIAHKLEAMGYPEKGTNNLLHKAKSYVSCAIGKLSEK